MTASRALIKILKAACSGELGASLVYHQHWRSLRDPDERAVVRKIEVEERAHRERVLEMLEQLGASPSRLREIWMTGVGHLLGFLCHWTGWYLPMYGAGLLESRNVLEYEEAARRAAAGGHDEFADDLVTMAEVEAEHEAYFRRLCERHWLHRYVPKWSPPAVLRARRQC